MGGRTSYLRRERRRDSSSKVSPININTFEDGSGVTLLPPNDGPFDDENFFGDDDEEADELARRGPNRSIDSSRISSSLSRSSVCFFAELTTDEHGCTRMQTD